LPRGPACNWSRRTAAHFITSGARSTKPHGSASPANCWRHPRGATRRWRLLLHAWSDGQEQELDPEGFLLAETRKILGEDIPIVVSLDLHGILTDRMLEHKRCHRRVSHLSHVDFYRKPRTRRAIAARLRL